MARTKQVFNTYEIAHLWMHQTQQSARHPQGNFSFDGDNLRSYSTTIARRVVNAAGDVAVEMLNQSWSVTTAKHQSECRQASRHLPTFNVTEFTTGHNGHGNTVFQRAIDGNLADYRQRITKQAMVVKKARQRKEWAFGMLCSLISEANHYAEFWGNDTRFALPTDSTDIADLVADQERIDSERLLREKLQREQAKRDAAEKIARWIAGDDVYVPRIGGEAFLRVVTPPEPSEEARKDKTLDQDLLGLPYVETSLGATVPLAHVVRALPIVLRLIAHGKTYQRNGHSIHVGNYTLDSIDKDGNVLVGCHTFSREEVTRFASLIGIAAE